MKREIKFRGLTPNGEWKYGNYHKFIEDDGEVFHMIVGFYRNEMDACVDYWDDVNPDTIGQFTGFRDKYENEVYDGDLVKFTAHTIKNMCMVLEDHERVGVVSRCEKTMAVIIFSNGEQYHAEYIKAGEVVGNIHAPLYQSQAEVAKGGLQ